MTENKNLLNYLNTIEPSISETVRKSVCIGRFELFYIYIYVEVKK
jgi:hypothetical protein